MRCLTALAFALAAGFAAVANAQLSGRGTEFWACWPRSHLSLETSAELVVFTDDPTDVVVDGAFSFPLTRVQPGMPLVVPIPDTVRLAAQRVARPVGFRVRSLTPGVLINVLLRVPRQAEASDDIARLLPTAELGSSYIVTAAPATLPNEPSYYAIIATRDGTTVNASIPCLGTTDVLELDAGEVYQVFCTWTDLPPDATGALVNASAPVVVLAGGADSFMPRNYLSGDFLVEAMVPIARWGNEHYVVALPKGPRAVAGAHDVARVTAFAATTLTVQDSMTSTAVPLGGLGAYVDLDVTEPLHLTSTRPVAVHLFAPGVEMSDLGDPFMAEVSPVRDYATSVRAYVPADYLEGSYLSIVTASASTADVSVNGLPVSGWAPLPGGTHSHLLHDIGVGEAEYLVNGTAPLSVLVHGYNDTYLPDPGLGRTPGSYGYPAPHAQPACVLFPQVAGPVTACNGLELLLSDAGVAALGCADVEYRWLRDGVPIPGCGVFWPMPECTVTFTGEAVYRLEVRCAARPSCIGAATRRILDQPPPPADILPDPAAICPGETLALEASRGYASYSWTSVPDDPGVTPRAGAFATLVVSPDVDTTYTLVASDGRGCTTTATARVTVLPDALPPPVDASLRARRSGSDDILFTWTDVPATPVKDYELVGLRCPSRTDCLGRLPDPVTMDAAAPVAAPVALGTELAIHVGAISAEELIFYKVRATSPCLGRPGACCNGFPQQRIACP